MINLIILWALLAIHSLNVVFTPMVIGKERKPIDAGTAAIRIFTSLCFIAAIIIVLIRGV